MLIRRARNSARITAAHSNKHQGPRSISRALKENTARHTISRATRGKPPDCGPRCRSATARRVVHLLLGHALVDEARRALRLVLRVVPSAGHLQPDQVRWEPAPKATGPLAVGL